MATTWNENYLFAYQKIICSVYKQQSECNLQQIIELSKWRTILLWGCVWIESAETMKYKRLKSVRSMIWCSRVRATKFLHSRILWCLIQIAKICGLILYTISMQIWWKLISRIGNSGFNHEVLYWILSTNSNEYPKLENSWNNNVFLVVKRYYINPLLTQFSFDDLNYFMYILSISSILRFN